jgi:hypothetical protein
MNDLSTCVRSEIKTRQFFIPLTSLGSNLKAYVI